MLRVAVCVDEQARDKASRLDDVKRLLFPASLPPSPREFVPFLRERDKLGRILTPTPSASRTARERTQGSPPRDLFCGKFVKTGSRGWGRRPARAKVTRLLVKNRQPMATLPYHDLRALQRTIYKRSRNCLFRTLPFAPEGAAQVSQPPPPPQSATVSGVRGRGKGLRGRRDEDQGRKELRLNENLWEEVRLFGEQLQRVRERASRLKKDSLRDMNYLSFE